MRAELKVMCAFLLATFSQRAGRRELEGMLLDDKSSSLRVHLLLMRRQEEKGLVSRKALLF